MNSSLPTRNGPSPLGKKGSKIAAYLPRLALAACLIVVTYCIWLLMGGGGGSSIAHGPSGLSMLRLGGPDAAAEGLRAARTMLRGVGQDSSAKTPLTAEGYTEYSKLRQELYCRDSASLDKPKGKITLLNDPMNTTMIEIDPLPVYISVYGGAQDIVSQALLAGHQWEATDLQEVLWALKVALPSDAKPTSANTPGLFVDIGANLGAFTFNVAAAGFEVMAFEGMGANQRLIRTALCASHRSVMDRVTLHGFGLGAARETCYLFADATNRGDGIPQCGAHNESHAYQLFGNPNYSIRGKMDIEKLEDVIQSDVKAMKIDVEGFEPFVMRGAMDLLKKHTVWFLIIEFNKPLLTGSMRQHPGMKRVDWVLDLVRMGYRISLKSFQGPFLDTEQQVIDMDAAEEPMNTNIYLVHRRINISAFSKHVILPGA